MNDLNFLLNSMTPTTLAALVNCLRDQLNTEYRVEPDERWAIARMVESAILAGEINCGDEFTAMLEQVN